MKKVEKISEGANYAAVNVGKWSDLGEHTLVLAPGVEMQGKVFVGEALENTGTEVSFETMPVGKGVPFLHTHKSNEELYIVVRGSGEYQVDGVIFPVAEGSVVRVSPKGRRSWRNTGVEPMVMICVQSKAGALKDLGVVDGEIVDGGVKW